MTARGKGRLQRSPWETAAVPSDAPCTPSQRRHRCPLQTPCTPAPLNCCGMMAADPALMLTCVSVSSTSSVHKASGLLTLETLSSCAGGRASRTLKRTSSGKSMRGNGCSCAPLVEGDSFGTGPTIVLVSRSLLRNRFPACSCQPQLRTLRLPRSDLST